MHMVTVSSKNQITLPVAILREIGISPGDRVAAAVVDGDIVLIKEPEDWVDYFRGSMSGAYGGTKDVIDRMVLRERESWYEPMSELTSGPDPREWRKQFEDLYATNTNVRAVANKLLDCPYHVATLHDLEWGILDAAAGPVAMLYPTLERLTTNQWVRRVPAEGQEPERYRLDSEIAVSLKAA